MSWGIIGNIFTQMHYIFSLLISGNLNIELQLLKKLRRWNSFTVVYSTMPQALSENIY